MKFGQRYNGNGYISHHADYIQFNICGLTAIEIVQRYFLYEIDKPIILLGDYSDVERNSKEDDMLIADRIYEIKDAIRSLKTFGAVVWAITLSPMSKKGLERSFSSVTFSQYIDRLNEIYQIPVLVKNRENKELFLSSPEEIIEFSKTNKITIDGAILFESCGYDLDIFVKTIKDINVDNVQELHIGNIDLGNRFPIGDGELNILDVSLSNFLKYTKSVPWVTFIESNGLLSAQFEYGVNSIRNAVKDD